MRRDVGEVFPEIEAAPARAAVACVRRRDGRGAGGRHAEIAEVLGVSALSVRRCYFSGQTVKGPHSLLRARGLDPRVTKKRRTS